jgi:hypothetical protein
MIASGVHDVSGAIVPRMDKMNEWLDLSVTRSQDRQCTARAGGRGAPDLIG